MNRTKWFAAALFCFSIMTMSAAPAQAESYTVSWSNMLAGSNVTWDNKQAYCDISVDWINAGGQIVQTFNSTPALKAYPYSEMTRTQVLSRSTTITDKCVKMRLHANCMTKPSPQWTNMIGQNYQLDVIPCASGPAEIRPYYTGIVWNPIAY